ncbi:MAG TPA: hypothetical protein DF712_07625 [Balneola sp.]|nr:hypothetical protein [Balneola sp.]
MTRNKPMKKEPRLTFISLLQTVTSPGATTKKPFQNLLKSVQKKDDVFDFDLLDLVPAKEGEEPPKLPTRPEAPPKNAIQPQERKRTNKEINEFLQDDEQEETKKKPDERQIIKRIIKSARKNPLAEKKAKRQGLYIMRGNWPKVDISLVKHYLGYLNDSSKRINALCVGGEPMLSIFKRNGLA